jgi:hypothetical protein
MKPTSRILLTIALLAMPYAVRADHGPGTSGGGAFTQTAETMKPGTLSADVRFDYTSFDSLSANDIKSKVAHAGGIDLLDSASLTTLSFGYGVAENFQLSLSLGYYSASGASDVEPGEDGELETATFDPDGITDMVVSGKYRFYHGPLGQFAFIGGLKIPTGRDEVTNSAGERVEPSATAGSGSWDYVTGLAYSSFLTPRLTLDASALYTFRTEHYDFRLGNRVDAGLALAYRFNEDVKAFPQTSAFVEANLRRLSMSEEEGEDDVNTGGTTFFVSPGFRVRFSPAVAFSIAVQVPLTQDLNGQQLETEYKVSAALSVTF